MPFFLLLPGVCALFEIKLRFSSKMNDGEREKEREREKKKKNEKRNSHPRLKSGGFDQLTSCLSQGSAVLSSPLNGAELYANEKLFPCLPI